MPSTDRAASSSGPYEWKSYSVPLKVSAATAAWLAPLCAKYDQQWRDELNRQIFSRGKLYDQYGREIR